MLSLLQALALPNEITPFERAHLERFNRIALWCLLVHIPLFGLIAWLNGMGALQTIALSTFALLGPWGAHYTLSNPRYVSIAIGIALMGQGGLLVHIGQGPVQIEMHFYFFAVLAMLAVFGNPMVIVAAATTVALHHGLFWAFLPDSVFNYQASIWVVALHALFVVIESVGACYIARSFFDNVIGLEKIVTSRTQALDERNLQMRLVLDHLSQGFVIVHSDGSLSQERSKILTRWFGRPEATTLEELLQDAPETFKVRHMMGWQELHEGWMPLELTLAQLPNHLELNDQLFELSYKALDEHEPPEQLLLVIEDITTAHHAALAELEREESMQLVERLLSDRRALIEFFEDASSLVHFVMTSPEDADLKRLRRQLHTLKGNCGFFGLPTIAQICHTLEDWIDQESRKPPAHMLARLEQRWQRLAQQLSTLLGEGREIIEIATAEHATIEAAILQNKGHDTLFEMVHGLKLEPIEHRFALIGQKTAQLAERLDKPTPHLIIEAEPLRLDPQHWSPFWSAFVHAIRNALDHGIEPPEHRLMHGKDEVGCITLRAKVTAGRFIIELEDDGRGIDWARLAQRAQALGLPCEQHEDLEQALFYDGLSTATQVTDISGRGVGMGALKAEAEAMGCVIKIHSRLGLGTCLHFSFPLDQLDPALDPSISQQLTLGKLSEAPSAALVTSC